MASAAFEDGALPTPAENQLQKLGVPPKKETATGIFKYSNARGNLLGQLTDIDLPCAVLDNGSGRGVRRGSNVATRLLGMDTRPLGHAVPQSR